MSNRKPICYLDSNLLIYLADYDKSLNSFKKKTRSFIQNKLLKKGITPVFSLWTQIETYCVVWQAAFNKLKSDPVPSAFDVSVKNETLKLFTKMLANVKLNGIQPLTKLEQVDLNSINSIFEASFTGRIWNKRKGIIKPNYPASPDLVHLEFAEKYQCEEFASFDKGFELPIAKTIFKGKINIVI